MHDPGNRASGTGNPSLEAAVQLAPLPMIAADAGNRIVCENHHWRQLAGSADRLPDPDRWADLLEPGSRRGLMETLDRIRAGGPAETVDLEMHLPGGLRWTRWWLQPGQVGDTPVTVIAAVDIHDDLKQRNDLRELATHDDLTGLVNRRFFLETVEQALRRAERFPEPACVMYIDLDGFKAINDRGGHSVGDRVLGAVANRLRLAVRAAEVVARIGGDEFAVLIERLTSPGEAAIVARRIEEAVNGSVEVGGDRWPISASIGMAISQGSDESAPGLISRADEAMYQAKRARHYPPRTAAEAAPPAVRSGPTPGPTPGPTSGPMSGPMPGPTPAPHPSEAPPLAAVIDVRSLQVGMETLRKSLETLLQGLDQFPD